MNAPADARRAYLRALITISVALVGATIILRFGRGLFLEPLNLSNENVVAAWFSGMLLLLGALHAADGYFRLRETNAKAAFAWWVIAAMLLFMSADEIGSLHERIKYLLKMGPWLSFVPFLIVLLAGCAWSFLQLWMTPSERRFVPGLILGFGILVSVGGQEYLEHAIRWPWYLSPFRSGFEEGSELAGMLILIYTTFPNSAGLVGPARSAAAGPAFSSVPMLRWFFVISAALVAWPLAQLSAILDGQADLGHPSDWLACALFALSAALLIARSPRLSDNARGLVSAVGFMVLASALCVQIDPIGDDTVFPFSRSIPFLGVDWNARLVLLGLCSFGAAEALRSGGAVWRGGAILLGVTGILSIIAAGIAFGEHALRWAYFLSTMAGATNLGALAFASSISRTVDAGSLSTASVESDVIDARLV